MRSGRRGASSSGCTASSPTWTRTSSEVDLGELRDAMLRAGFFGAVVDDDSLKKWFDEPTSMSGRVSFSEFARISVSGLDYFGSDHAGRASKFCVLDHPSATSSGAATFVFMSIPPPMLRFFVLGSVSPWPRWISSAPALT